MAEPVKVKKVPTIEVPDKEETPKVETPEVVKENPKEIILEESPKDILDVEEGKGEQFDFAKELWKALKK